MSVEFQVSQESLAVVRNTVIEANFDEVKAALTEMIEPYKSMVVSEDAISAAKNDRANIRKVAGRIDEMRKTVKKAYSEPLKAFEDKCKELVSIVDEGAANLDGQIKAFEEAERDAKIAEIRAAYDELAVGELADYYPWDRFYNPKWENKGVTAEAAAQEISRGLADTVNDLNAIRQMGGDDTTYLLDVYKQTHDLSAVIRKASELKTMREREAARKREVEKAKERAVAIEAAKIDGMIRANEIADAIRASHKPVVEADEEPLITVTFRVQCTKAQLTDLGQYMRANGIRYGRAN